MKKNILLLSFFLLSCSVKEKNKEQKLIGLVSKTNDKKVLQKESKVLSAFFKKGKEQFAQEKELLQHIKTTYKEKKWTLFHQYRLQFLSSLPQRNSKNIATVYNYSGAYFRHQMQQDSAYFYYYKSYQYYLQVQDIFNTGSMLLNMAIIQKNSYDFIGSEASSFKAISYLKPKNSQRELASAYNNLGIVYNELDDFKNAITYHQKAYSIRKMITNRKILEIHSLNNMGNVYKKQHYYTKAIDYYKKAMGYASVLKKYPKTKAKLIDNYANALLLKKELVAPTLFLKALTIRDSLQDVLGKIRSYIHLGEYYLDKKEKNRAKKYLLLAKNLSKATKIRRDYLASILLLIKVSTEKEGILLANEYIFLKDSLQKADRKKREQFSRIRFETDEKENENLQLKSEKTAQALLLEKENQQKKYLGLGLLATLFVLGVFGYYHWQNKKQKVVIESLQKELHHRVTNNLAIINALIDDIKELYPQQDFTTKLVELQNRIDSMDEIHNQLYKKEDITNLQLKKYVTKLANNVQSSFAKEYITVTNNIEDGLQLPVEKSFPIGLIINEFLTNSYKYAFNHQQKGEIIIDVKENNNNFVLTLSDNGKGLPKDLDITILTSFGMEIMQLLSKQLNGSFKLDGVDGVSLEIEFPK